MELSEASNVQIPAEPSIEFWQEYIMMWAERKGWNKEERPFGDWIALFHTEISEAYEDYRNHHELNEVYFEQTATVNGDVLSKPNGIPIELADLVIRVLHFCAAYGIDLNEMIAMKMAYNEKRPYRHGGKKT